MGSVSNMRTGFKPSLPELPDWLVPIRNSTRFRRQSLGAGLRNQVRGWRKEQLDFVVFPVGGSLPERNGPPVSFVERQIGVPPRQLSLQTLNAVFEKIIDAPNVKGVVLVLRGIGASPARLQSARRAIERLRQAGKRVVVYTPYLDLVNYYLASAADLVIAPPSAEFNVVGLQSEALFFKDSLAIAGVEADVIAVSPYKSAMSELTSSTISAEAEQQINWLLDDTFDVITADIAEDRLLEQGVVKSLINRAPFSGVDAVENELIDAIGYEDELPELLARAWPDCAHGPDDQIPKAKLETYVSARKKLLETVRRETKSYIGVINVVGTIVMSGNPSRLPIPVNNSPVAAEVRITQQLRKAERDKDLAALIIYVDSGGGGALASDLIWRQLDRIRYKKPIVIYMGSVAASGGYYIAAGGDHIMANRSTITGSIGVVMGRISTSGLEDKLRVNHVRYKRGNNAGLFRDNTPMTATERTVLWARLMETYMQFKQVVSNSRDIPLEALEAVCGGRVWTGRQAHGHQLVDSFGDFQDAVEKAKVLANLSESGRVRVPVKNVTTKSSYTLPKPYDSAETFESTLANHPLSSLLDAFDPAVAALFTGETLAMLPFKIRFW